MRKLAFVAALIVLSGGLVRAQNPVADQNASAPQSHDNKGQAVTGKTQPNNGRKETPETTTGSAGQTTPGINTEAGQEQKPYGNSDIEHTAAATPRTGNPKTAAPHNDSEAGQSQQEADRNAQAASRAEIQAGPTLGVNGTTNSSTQSGETSQARASDLPQTDQSAQSQRNQPKGKTATAKKAKKKPAATKATQ